MGPIRKDVNGRTLKVGHVVVPLNNTRLTCIVNNLDDTWIELATVAYSNFNIKVYRRGYQLRILEPEELI